MPLDQYFGFYQGNKMEGKNGPPPVFNGIFSGAENKNRVTVDRVMAQMIKKTEGCHQY